MAKVYEFPVKKKLPKNIEERLHKVAQEYMEVLYASLVLLSEEGTNQMTYEEILELVSETYAEGLYKAVEQLEES